MTWRIGLANIKKIEKLTIKCLNDLLMLWNVLNPCKLSFQDLIPRPVDTTFVKLQIRFFWHFSSLSLDDLVRHFDYFAFPILSINLKIFKPLLLLHRRILTNTIFWYRGQVTEPDWTSYFDLIVAVAMPLVVKRALDFQAGQFSQHRSWDCFPETFLDLNYN